MMSIQQQPLASHEVDLKRTVSHGDDEISIKKRRINSNDNDEDVFHGQIFKSYIQNALDALDKQKDTLLIDRLTTRINLPPNDIDSLSIGSLSEILRNLSQEISRIDNKGCQKLILSLINLNAVKYRDNSQFIKNYQFFLTVLVSGIPKWWNEISTKIVADFIYSNVDFHHSLLKKVLNILPSSINTLQKRLRSMYPNKNNRKRELLNYVDNLLVLSQYCHELNYQNWCLIIENCIKLDVELQNELDELSDDEDSDEEDEEEEESEEEDEEEEDEQAEDNIDELDEEDFDEAELNINTSSVNEISSKLDSIMVVLLEKTTALSQDLDTDNGVEMYNILSTLFKTHILPTHLTRCIQYLLFNLASRHEQLMDSFLYLLIETSFQSDELLNNRIKSMQYISSFVARCKNLPQDKLVFVTSFLISWMDRFILEREIEVDESNSNLLDKFKLFYHCFQTLLYIFCFRFKQLKKNNGEWECGIDRFFQKAIITKFNPLKFCNENVVNIFARLSAREDVCYCFSILDKIKKENYGLNHQQININDLNGYFPFDPLMLKKSKKIIKENYLDWSDVQEDEDDDDDDDDDEEE